MFSLVWSYRRSRAVLVFWGIHLQWSQMDTNSCLWKVGMSSHNSHSPAAVLLPKALIAQQELPAQLMAQSVGVIHKLSSCTQILFPLIHREFPTLPGLFINKYKSLCTMSIWLISFLVYSAYISEWSHFLAGKRTWRTLCLEKHHRIPQPQ